MVNFIMVKYNNKKYPQEIPCEINEIAGHFDKKTINQKNRYSLHTEYSYEKRNFDSTLLEGLDEIKNSNKKGIPQLWKSKKWAREFFNFIESLLSNCVDPEIIEIHPPFIDYCGSIDIFLNTYEVFEKLILDKYNNVKIFIENRNGTHYGNNFILSNCNDIINICKKLSERELKLNIVLDYPQLMSSEGINSTINKIINFNNELNDYRKYIGGIHLWGKKIVNKRLIAHNGNLDTLFNNNLQNKELFLNSLHNTFDDNIVRYMVLEVNSSNNDLNDIVNDLKKYSFRFI